MSVSNWTKKGTYAPELLENLTEEEIRLALRALTLVKEKRCGRVKGRTVADRRKQRNYISKEDSTSPTVSNEALFITIAINAKEQHCVATADIVGAYLNTDMQETIIIVYEGEMVDYMVAANPKKYRPYVRITKRGTKILYLRLLKALYGCLKSALLWYKLFLSTLIALGFELNPYDPCAVNKMIDGKQCTICWYVNDIKISHKEQTVIKKIIDSIELAYRKMTVIRGRKHTYVGMNVEYPESWEAKISMFEYIHEAISDFLKDCTDTVQNPAAAHLFEVNNNCKK